MRTAEKVQIGYEEMSFSELLEIQRKKILQAKNDGCATDEEATEFVRRADPALEIAIINKSRKSQSESQRGANPEQTL